VFNQADVCHQWTVNTLLRECGYPRIAIQIRHLGKVVPGFPAGKVAAGVCEGSGIQPQGVCDNVDGASLLQAVRKQVTFGSVCHAACQSLTQAFAIWGF